MIDLNAAVAFLWDYQLLSLRFRLRQVSHHGSFAQYSCEDLGIFQNKLRISSRPQMEYLNWRQAKAVVFVGLKHLLVQNMFSGFQI